MAEFECTRQGQVKSVRDIRKWQQDVGNQPTVWLVWNTYQGELSLLGIYDTKEAAQVHADWNNTTQPRVGRASISKSHIMNIDLAIRRFGTPAND